LKAWTNHELRDLTDMRARGVTHLQISKLIGRSYSGVVAKCSKMDIRNQNRVQRQPPVIRPTTWICHAAIPEYYRQGWRYLRPEGALYVFEWGGVGDPRWPKVTLAEVA